MADFRSVEKARLRTSTTAASRGTAPLARRARSAMVGSRSGGMLSATNQSRSSSDLAAVLRPGAGQAGDDHDLRRRCRRPHAAAAVGHGRSPRSCRCPPRACRGRPRPGAAPRRPPRRSAGRSRAARRSRSTVAAPQLAHRAEVPQQRSPPGLAKARNAVQLADGQRGRALLAVIGDGEPVRLVPDPLQQVQALAGARQDHRAVVAGQPDLLQPLGQPADGHVDDADLLQRPRPPRRPGPGRRR